MSRSAILFFARASPVLVWIELCYTVISLRGLFVHKVTSSAVLWKRLTAMNSVVC